MENKTDTAWLASGENPNFLKYCWLIYTRHILFEESNRNDEQLKYLKQIEYDTLQKKQLPAKYIGMKPSAIKFLKLELVKKNKDIFQYLMKLMKDNEEFIRAADNNLAYRVAYEKEDIWLVRRAMASIDLPSKISPSDIKKYHDEYVAQLCIEEMLKEQT